MTSQRVLRSGGVVRCRGGGGHGERVRAQAVHGQESGEDGQDEEHAGAQPEGVARMLRLLVHSGHRSGPFHSGKAGPVLRPLEEIPEGGITFPPSRYPLGVYRLRFGERSCQPSIRVAGGHSPCSPPPSSWSSWTRRSSAWPCQRCSATWGSPRVICSGCSTPTSSPSADCSSWAAASPTSSAPERSL